MYAVQIIKEQCVLLSIRNSFYKIGRYDLTWGLFFFFTKCVLFIRLTVSGKTSEGVREDCHSLGAYKNTLKKTISEITNLSRSKKSNEGLRTCSFRGTVKRRNCCKGCRVQVKFHR